MDISPAQSRFKRWSHAHQPCRNDNEHDVARADALTGVDASIEAAVMTPPEDGHAPWLVPGVGDSF